MALSDDDFKRLVAYIKEHYGLNLEKKRTLVEGRLHNIIREYGFTEIGDFLQQCYLDKSGELLVVLLNRLTTNHTYFMREWDHFEIYRDQVLPFWKSQIKDNDLRIWSAGCSLGNEPYTLAMINNDFFGPLISQWDCKILATDISVRALTEARNGVYSADVVKDVPMQWRQKYFVKLNDGAYKVDEKIRDSVIYKIFNLMDKQLPFRKKFHCIFCRNVMIYFDRETRAELINRFYSALEPGGFFFVGQSEALEKKESPFVAIKSAAYRKV